jgi:type IV secretion system protein VirD4
MTEAHRRAAGSTIIDLNPFNVLDMGSTGFNPIASMDVGEEFPDDALELAESVIRVEGKDPHWGQSAQELVAALIMYVRLVIPGGSFADVRALLGQDDDGIRAMVRSPSNFQFNGRSLPGMLETAIEEGWDEIAVKVARFGDINPENRELHGVISTALTQTRWLDSRPIKADLQRAPYDFSALKENPTTVYLVLPARRLVTHSAWLRLMIASVIQKLMRDTRRSRVPVLFMLDEYFALAEGDGFPVIQRNMALFRGYGIKLLTVWQDLAQAKALYGPEGFESFLGNAGVVQTFAPQDVVTAEYFSQRSGQTTREIVTTGRALNPSPLAPGGAQMSQNTNVGLIPIAPLLPQEIRNLDDGYSIVFSHMAKGPVRCFTSWPGDVPHLREIMRRDPSNRT